MKRLADLERDLVNAERLGRNLDEARAAFVVAAAADRGGRRGVSAPLWRRALGWSPLAALGLILAALVLWLKPSNPDASEQQMAADEIQTIEPVIGIPASEVETVGE